MQYLGKKHNESSAKGRRALETSADVHEGSIYGGTCAAGPHALADSTRDSQGQGSAQAGGADRTDSSSCMRSRFTMIMGATAAHPELSP